MIVEEKNQDKIKDLLTACLEQPEKVHRVILETEPTFERSKLRALLSSKKWPVAVHPNLLIDNENEEDKFGRAENILDVVVHQPIQDKKFLDFGCGEGHVALKAGNRARLAVGYDIDETGWEKFRATDRFFLTSDFNEVHKHGPYDVVLLYDVLDHVMAEEPQNVLRDIRSILKDDGRIYVRFHPWCSKHGMHTYKSLNKAFVHFFFGPEELEQMGIKFTPTRKIIHPIVTYDDWILKAGLKKIDSETQVSREQVDPFFQQEELLVRLVKSHWKDSHEERLSSGKVFPLHQLDQCFIDMVLVKDR